jgi:hypothetical protein
MSSTEPEAAVAVDGASSAGRASAHIHAAARPAGSNTGCLCSKSLAGAELLLRGHAPHDEQLSALLADPDYTTALLWPGEDALEPHQLQELAAARSNGRIALVAIDATWNCAIKMRRRLPEGKGTALCPYRDWFWVFVFLTTQHSVPGSEQETDGRCLVCNIA